MKIYSFVIFIIFAIITFKAKDKRFPNHPYLGWIVCMVGIAVGLYLMYYFGEQSANNATLKNTKCYEITNNKEVRSIYE